MKELLLVQHHLKKDEIVDKTSRMIKDTNFSSIGGMSEVGTRWLQELNTLLFELQMIEMEIARFDIDNSKV